MSIQFLFFIIIIHYFRLVKYRILPISGMWGKSESPDRAQSPGSTTPTSTPQEKEGGTGLLESPPIPPHAAMRARNAMP